MLATCKCPSCGCLLRVPEESLGRRAICPKCSAEFDAAAPTTVPASPAPDAIEPAHMTDPFPQGAPADRHYLTEHPRTPRRFREEADSDHPPDRFLARGLPGGGRAVAVMIFLGLTILCDAAGLAVDYLEYGLIEDALRGIQPNQAQATLYDSLERGIGVLDLVLYYTTAVLFCVWTYRAYKNLPRLGIRGLKHSPGWAVGYFFIPILNLFKPCVVFLEMWRACDPKAPLDDAYAWQERSGGALIGFWWAFWIISRVTAYVATRASWDSPNPTLQELKFQIGALTLARIASTLAAILAIFVVMRIQGRETESYRRLGEAEAGYLEGSVDEEG